MAIVNLADQIRSNMRSFGTRNSGDGSRDGHGKPSRGRDDMRAPYNMAPGREPGRGETGHSPSKSRMGPPRRERVSEMGRRKRRVTRRMRMSIERTPFTRGSEFEMGVKAFDLQGFFPAYTQCLKQGSKQGG